ncbi:major facilitator superfamily transporter [Diaporthe helianthi]|uniref:Major facilitator superfamily transporter n=1 Tax=Diaporthe helianthi TaxID=158607 RepID=A0A2P5HIQ9_DIAHE|nr:major facilitator superfamily transporter [Diaporthe helianthi]
MQSIRQYRHLFSAVKAQVRRDQEMARGRTLLDGAVNDGEPPAALRQDEHPNPEKAGQDDADHRRASVESVIRLWLNTTCSSTTNSEEGSDEGSNPAQRVPTDDATQYTSARAALGDSLTGVHATDRRTLEGEGSKVFVVGWDGPDDPLNPRNWTYARRISCTLKISIIAATVGAASAIDATVLPQAARSLGVSEVAESLATGLYLIGVGVGSLVAGPFSETFGRNAVYSGSVAIFMVWIMACGLAPNFGAQVVFRFLAGCSASTPLVCSGGSVSDMFDSVEKTWAFPLYAIAGFGGPMLGAVVGAYIGPSMSVSWRWAEWAILMLSALVVCWVFFLMPETYAPLLLRWKARHLRRVTGDDRFRSEHEIVKATLVGRLKISMTRPFLMFTEPIILAMTLYLSVVYIVLFTFLVGWPYIFEYTYGIPQSLSNIIFISMFVGLQFTFLLIPIVYRITTRQIREAESRGRGQSFNPETRLWYAMLGPAVSIPISLFWMGWTASPRISIWSPILAAALFGFGVMGLLICTYLYVIDSYETFSASALTFTTLVRYLAAGGMTVVGIPFYANVGVCYTLTILACISCVLVPVPYVLYKWGYLLRKRSKYAVSREI